jgi:hypothetical protein
LTEWDSFQVKAERVEVHVVPYGIRPHVSFLHILSLMIAVYVEPNLIVEMIQNWKAIEVNRQLLIGDMVNLSRRTKFPLGPISGCQEIRIDVETCWEGQAIVG